MFNANDLKGMNMEDLDPSSFSTAGECAATPQYSFIYTPQEYFIVIVLLGYLMSCRGTRLLGREKEIKAQLALPVGRQEAQQEGQ